MRKLRHYLKVGQEKALAWQRLNQHLRETLDQSAGDCSTRILEMLKQRGQVIDALNDALNRLAGVRNEPVAGLLQSLESAEDIDTAVIAKELRALIQSNQSDEETLQSSLQASTEQVRLQCLRLSQNRPGLKAYGARDADGVPQGALFERKR